jgi:hypothetical protein
MQRDAETRDQSQESGLPETDPSEGLRVLRLRCVCRGRATQTTPGRPGGQHNARQRKANDRSQRGLPRKEKARV